MDNLTTYHAAFLAPDEADSLYHFLLVNIPWKQQHIIIFGKKFAEPRLTCWMSENGLSYKYSGLTMEPMLVSERVMDLKIRIEKTTGAYFNAILLNLYRNGNDYMGWHRDNEKELGPEPFIASVSLGTPRKFCYRSFKHHNKRNSLWLEHGSLLTMQGKMQQDFEHSLPKSKLITEPRINLTFRKIIPALV